jgi:hypothetical protein
VDPFLQVLENDFRPLCVIGGKVINPGRHVALGLHRIVPRFLFTDGFLDLVNNHPERVLLPILRRVHFDGFGDGEQGEFPDALPTHHWPVVLRCPVRPLLILSAPVSDP